MKPIPILTDFDIFRFWLKVYKKGEDDCWNWKGSISGKNSENPRPTFSIRHNMYHSNRIAYYIEYKIDPGDLYVCHDCDNSICVNPNHLWLGTQSDNMLDCRDKGRHFDYGRAKIFEEDVKLIRYLYEQGSTYMELAIRFNLSKSNIRKIVKYRIWTHV